MRARARSIAARIFQAFRGGDQQRFPYWREGWGVTQIKVQHIRHAHFGVERHGGGIYSLCRTLSARQLEAYESAGGPIAQERGG